MSLIHKINLQFWLGVAVTTLFIVVLLYRVKFEEVILTVREANYLFVVPAIGIYFVALYFAEALPESAPRKKRIVI